MQALQPHKPVILPKYIYSNNSTKLNLNKFKSEGLFIASTFPYLLGSRHSLIVERIVYCILTPKSRVLTKERTGDTALMWTLTSYSKTFAFFIFTRNIGTGAKNNTKTYQEIKIRWVFTMNTSTSHAKHNGVFLGKLCTVFCNYRLFNLCICITLYTCKLGWLDEYINYLQLSPLTVMFMGNVCHSIFI